ncbi:hypothetical protein T492DRAFT_885002, partial [Pavlovales sp. CCMP2436]
GILFSAGNDGLLRRYDSDTGAEEKLTSVAVPGGESPQFVFTFVFTNPVTIKEVFVDGTFTGYDYRCRLFSGHYDATQMMMWDTSVFLGGDKERHGSPVDFPRTGSNSRLPWQPASLSFGSRLDSHRSSHRASRLDETGAEAETDSDDSEERSFKRAGRTPLGLLFASPGGREQPLPSSGGTPSSRERSKRRQQTMRKRELLIKTVPRSSAARFTHTPASSVLTMVIDGPMVTLTAVLYSLAHPMWRATAGAQLGGGAGLAAISARFTAWLRSLSGAEAGSAAEAEFGSFVRMYWFSVGCAVLVVVLFFGRVHERCVYALRFVKYEFKPNFTGNGGMGRTDVVYASWTGKLLYYAERFLVYFVILLGGAGFFMISRYLLRVIECADGRWRVNAQIECFGPEHVRFFATTFTVFPVYILVACRMSASYNDVTYLSEVEDDLPSTSNKMSQLMRTWGSTVVKRAGLWTRHPKHGWKFGLTGRLCILFNWIADLLIEGFDRQRPNHLRWISVALWTMQAYVLVHFALRFQPMAEPFSSKVLVVFRAILAATYLTLALTCALVVFTGADTYADEWRDSALRRWSLYGWLLVLLCAVPGSWAVASRWHWQVGNETIAEAQAQAQLRADGETGGQQGGGDGEHRVWGLGSFGGLSLLPPSDVEPPKWNRMGKRVQRGTFLLRGAPVADANSSPDSALPAELASSSPPHSSDGQRASGDRASGDREAGAGLLGAVGSSSPGGGGGRGGSAPLAPLARLVSLAQASSLSSPAALNPFGARRAAQGSPGKGAHSILRLRSPGELAPALDTADQLEGDGDGDPSARYRASRDSDANDYLARRSLLTVETQ